MTSTTHNDTKQAVQSFWLLGLLNNSPWVLMLACATNISSGGVALVILTKLTAPCWFHKVSYRTRMKMASLAMGVACFLVGCGGLFNDEMSSIEGDGGGNGEENNDQSDDDNTTRAQLGLMLELLGVSFTSFQCSLGEASLLALAGKFDSSYLPQLSPSSASGSLSLDSYSAVDNDNSGRLESHSHDEDLFSHEEYPEHNNAHANDDDDDEQSTSEGILMKSEKQQRKCITAFSSGTGCAGIVGYAYKSLLAELFGWGLSTIVWSAILFAVAYYRVYCAGLYEMDIRLEEAQTRLDNERCASSAEAEELNGTAAAEQRPSVEMVTQPEDEEENDSPTLLSQLSSELTTTTKSVHHMTACERFQTVLSLWPYTIPLFFVYMTEYMMQAGVWPAIGFPVTSASARGQFYHYANWTYQVGVFVSRSSGNMFTVSLTMLWVMPMLQLVNLCLFWLISVHHFWYDFSLLIMCFVVGLLGGGVYVQGYNRINADMPKELREFALSSASVADSVGILVADISSLFIQSCIYQRNGIDGAVVNCPL
mmetsp:Transcript_20919/g.31928  ORF Transcript_20919/g.31928 Transcript_20919/m.31928 type:complete len:538 (+) Transcript_20919:127-1740(+)